jgi:hypothetical protein
MGESHFKLCLNEGHKGELRMLQLQPTWRRTDGLKEDFILPDGEYMELKTERRTTMDTPNIAVELSSSAGRPGALENAISNNCRYICYLFADDKYFIYDAVKLLEYVKKAAHRVVSVPNAGYKTTVMLVPRSAIKELECQF